jgi:Domain of unknown function (DUF5666)
MDAVHGAGQPVFADGDTRPPPDLHGADIPPRSAVRSTGTAIAPFWLPPAFGIHVNKPIVRLIVAAAVLSTAACGRHDIDVINATAPTAPGSGSTSQSNPSVPVVVSGAITAINATAQTLVVSGTTVIVPAGARLDDGQGGTVAFSALQVGWHVTIRATRVGSVITASEIVVDERVAPTVEIEGRVSALNGTCPALTFMIDSITISTSASTTFSGGTCAQLANGALVTVDGNGQPNASVTATRVSNSNR